MKCKYEHGPPHQMAHRAPLWRTWGHHEDRFRGWHHVDPRRRRGCLFARFLVAFGLMSLLIAGGIGVVGFVATRLFGDGPHLAPPLGAVGVGLAFSLLLSAVILGRRAWVHVAHPLADVMAAADAVAEGDMSARVEERGSGDFAQLARSFNRMVEELERSDQQRRNLTADVAHELRTPLHIIQGNLEGIIDGVYAPTEGHIAATLDETRSLARLVEDLRTLSRAEAGQLPLICESANLHDLLADVRTSFSGQAEAAGVSLLLDLHCDEPLLVWGDVGRLDQVLSNLVANALRYTPQGGRIEIAAGRLEGGVWVHVADTGVGISPEDLPYVFDRFWKGDRSRTRAEGAGSGLGLAIARQLVHAHGGTIEVSSILGEGTTFRIELPVERTRIGSQE